MSDNNFKSQTIVMKRVFVKDVSFESPSLVKTMSSDWTPDTHLDMNTKVSRVNQKTFEVVLALTLTVKNGGETAYLCEVQQAGLFLIEEATEEQRKKLLSCDAPAMLFPYVREMIGSLVSKGGFPTLLLAPVDFDVLYQNALTEQAQKS